MAVDLLDRLKTTSCLKCHLWHLGVGATREDHVPTIHASTARVCRAAAVLPGCLYIMEDAGGESPEQVLADEQPDNVRVTLIDGSQVEVFQPTVSGDTLTGLREGQRVSIPLASVSELELREGDSGKTVLLAAGIVIGVGAALVLGALIYCESQGGCWEN